MKNSHGKRILNLLLKKRGGKVIWKGHLKSVAKKLKQQNLNRWAEKDTHIENTERWKERLKISLFYLFNEHFIIFTKDQRLL